jgi:hypothetical protein
MTPPPKAKNTSSCNCPTDDIFFDAFVKAADIAPKLAYAENNMLGLESPGRNPATDELSFFFKTL